MIRSLVAGISLAAAFFGCRSSEQLPPLSPRSGEEAALDRARVAAQQLANTLRARLSEAYAQGGAAAAIRVCAREASYLTREVATKTGVRVGRASLRLRNPAAAPPIWVTEWLRVQGERSATGVSGIKRVEATLEGRSARLLLPIAVDGLCVACHGPKESLSKEVREVLERSYPKDQAVGYRPGDLRGALWAEVAVPD
jgi:hypothetical protein